MSRVHILGLFLFVPAVILGCRPGELPPPRSIVVVGSRSLLPLMQDIVERFQTKHPDIRINIESGYGERAIGETRVGLADIGLLGRSLRPEETRLQGHVLARDGIAFVVHRGNPVPALQETHLVGVLTRVYTTWKDVGGSDRPIVVIGPGEGRAIRDVVLEQFALRTQQLRPDPAIGSSEQVLEAVAGQPAAIGYVSLGAAEQFARKQGIRILPFHGVPATIENVRNKTYPLIRNLLLLTRETPEGSLKVFLDYALSDEVHDLITKYGYVSPTP